MTRTKLEAMRTMVAQAQTDPGVARDFLQFYAAELVEYAITAHRKLEENGVPQEEEE